MSKVERVLREAFPSAHIHLADRGYSIPSSTFIKGKLRSSFGRHLVSEGFSYYSVESWDCDDYSRELASFGTKCHKGSGLTTGFPLFEMWYTTRAGLNHAINVCVVDDFELLYIEPQNHGVNQQWISELISTEVASVSFVR